MRVLRKYLPFVTGSIKDNLAYRGGLIGWLLVDVLYVLVMIFTWRAVFDSAVSTTLEGYTFGTMIGYLMIRSIIAGSIYSNAADQIADDFKDGSIGSQLIKPISYMGLMFARTVGGVAVYVFFFALPYAVATIIIGLQFDTGIDLSGWMPLWLVMSIFLSMIINFLISFSFGIIIFYTFNGFGVWQLMGSIELLFSGTLLPLTFYPDWLYRIAMFLPFAQVIYSPILLAQGQTDPFSVLGSQLLWVAIMLSVSLLGWNATKSKVMVQGG